MLKLMTAVLLTVTVVWAWVPLEPIPGPAAAERGSAITYGTGRIWGVFPNQDSEETYFRYFDPQDGHWHNPGEDLYYLTSTAITFQWRESGVVYVVGNEDGEDPVLYWYDLAEEDWGRRVYRRLLAGRGCEPCVRAQPRLQCPVSYSGLALLPAR